MAYKFLITLNSGAFIVLLTFVGNTTSDGGFVISLDHMRCALLSFLAAIALTFVSMTIAYLSTQFSLLDKSLPGGKNAIGHVLWLIIPVIAAFLVFCSGALSAIYGISGK